MGKVQILTDKETKKEISAQTLNGSIKINYKFMSKSFMFIMKYIVHELVHVFQHMKGEDTTIHGEYLDDKSELDAFKKQISFESKVDGKNDAVDYAKKLIRFHKYPKKKRKEKLEELTEEISDGSSITSKS